MAERAKHLFQFSANQISESAREEAKYHEGRLRFWKSELDKATSRVEATAGVKISRVEVTGGWRPEIVLDYGDPAAYQRMSEAGRKIQDHDKAMQRYQSDASLYATQSRTYELDADDVAHFRFNARPREE